MNIPIRLTPTGDGLRKLLGPLEADIMDIIWTGQRPYTGRQVHRQMLTQRDLAYTTVMTTMVRLAEKGILIREPMTPKRGRGATYVYTAMVNEAAFVDHAITEVVQSLLRDYPAQVRRALGVRHGHAI
jgi:predicted transcriptional regulator